MSYNIENINSINYDYDYFCHNNVCRLCWSENAVNEINTTESGKKHCLIDKIHYSLDINIDSNDPNKLCDECLENIDKFYEFKLFCKESDRRLKKLFSDDLRVCDSIKSDIKLEIDPEDNINEAFNSDNEEEPLISFQKRKYTKSKLPDFYCKRCRSDYFTEEKLLKHNRDIHEITSEGLFKCAGCERMFNIERSRRSHELKYCKTLKKGYFCHNCDRYLQKRKMYESHKLKHSLNIPMELPENVFRCVKCKEHFESRQILMQHFDEIHRKKNHFVCEQCGRVFRRLDYLNKHKLTHNGVKKHVCPHCGHRTNQKSSLNIHLRKHTGDKPFQCDLCPLKCLTSSNLIAHKLTHAGVKKFECDLCPKKFGYKISLEEHIAATHDKIKLYICNICHTSYSRSGGLRRHLRSKHGKKTTENNDYQENKLIEFKNKNNYLIENMDNNI